MQVEALKEQTVNPAEAMLQWYSSLEKKEQEFVALHCFPILESSKLTSDGFVVGSPPKDALAEYLKNLVVISTLAASPSIGAVAGMVDITVATWESTRHWKKVEATLTGYEQRALSNGDPRGTLPQVQAAIADLPAHQIRAQDASQAWNTLRATVLAPATLSEWALTNPFPSAVRGN